MVPNRTEAMDRWIDLGKEKGHIFLTYETKGKDNEKDSREALIWR